MTGRGSIRHNNRSFSAANVDRSRSGQNVTFCNEDLKKVYHELFDEALAAYNAKKKKTRDKIPDYYEHIRQSKQEKLFHEAIFQIGNLTDCGCGSPGGERAAAALKEFAESFQERNPHLRVFNMVLHMDEATPHLHVDFVPVATEQSRGLSTRVSMKQALKQQGFEGLGRKQTEWKAWMEREKEALTEIAQAHEFEIISLGGGRPHMELPEYRAAAQRLEAVQEQVIAAEQEIAALEKQRKALQGNVKLLKAVEKVKPDLDAIQPEKTLTGAAQRALCAGGTDGAYRCISEDAQRTEIKTAGWVPDLHVYAQALGKVSAQPWAGRDSLGRRTRSDSGVCVPDLGESLPQ